MKLSDDDVRDMFNGARDGTANDAIKRQLCRVALGELCVYDDMYPTADHLRYPTREERAAARSRLYVARELGGAT